MYSPNLMPWLQLNPSDHRVNGAVVEIYDTAGVVTKTVEFRAPAGIVLRRYENRSQVDDDLWSEWAIIIPRGRVDRAPECFALLAARQ